MAHYGQHVVQLHKHCAASVLVRGRPAAHICNTALLGPSCSSKHRCFSRVQPAAAAAGEAVPLPSQPQRSIPARSRLLSWLPDRQAVQLFWDALELLYSNIWAVLAVFAAKDAAAFVLHRLVHRLTNYIAEAGLGIPISSLGNPWWIMMDAKFMEGHVGYQVLVGVFFLLCLPINILFNTAAVASAAVVAINRQAALSAPGVPTASFTGQGRGKVGLADYPRPPPNCSEDSEGCDISPAGSTSIDSTDDSSSDTQSTYSSSSSSRRGFGGGSALALFRGGYATVTFARASAATSNASSSSAAAVAQQQPPSASPATQPDQAAAVDSSSSSGSVLAAPAPAPALPWLTVVQERSKPPPLLGPGPSITAVKVAWRDQVSCRIQGLWRVDLLFNLWALPLQAASLLILPVFWTFPRLLGIQLSMPAAVLGGLRGSAALQESRRLMAGFKTSYAWPFVWLIVAGRLQEMLREVVLLAMPNRWWTDVPEVPLVVTALFFAVRMLLLRVQDLLPLAAYLLLVRQRKATAAADTASSSTSSCW